MTRLICGLPRDIFGLLCSFIEYEEVKNLWHTGDEDMRHSLARLSELSMDIASSSSAAGPLLAQHFTGLEKLNIVNGGYITPFDVSILPSTLRSLTLGYKNAHLDLTKLPPSKSLEMCFPHLEELICSSTISVQDGNTLGALPAALTRLDLRHFQFTPELIASLPRSILDLRIQLNINTTLAPGQKIEFPPSLIRLHIPTTGDVRFVYQSLPPTVTDFEELSQSFGIPPPFNLLPSTLLALKCSLHILVTSLAEALPRGLLFLHLDFQQAISIETLKALPSKDLRYLHLKASWSQCPIQGSWDDIYAALPCTLTSYSIGSLGGANSNVTYSATPPFGKGTSEAVLAEGDSKHPLGRTQLLKTTTDAQSHPIVHPDRLKYSFVFVSQFVDQTPVSIPTGTRYLHSMSAWDNLTPTFTDHICSLAMLRVLDIKKVDIDLRSLKAPLEELRVSAASKLPSPLPSTLQTLALYRDQSAPKTPDHSIERPFIQSLPHSLTSLSVVGCDIEFQVLLVLPPYLTFLELATLHGTLEPSYFENLPSSLTRLEMKLQEPTQLNTNLCRLLPRKLRIFNMSSENPMLEILESEVEEVIAILPLRMSSFGSSPSSFAKISQGLDERLKRLVAAPGREIK